MEKSDFGPMPVPVSLVGKIEQSDAAVKINRTKSGQNGDGMTILIARHLKSAQGETDQKMIMVKQ